MEKCPCCASNKLCYEPYSLSCYSRCVNCGLVFSESGSRRDNTLSSLYYLERDPHLNVAQSKRAFYKLALLHLEKKFNGVRKRRLLDVGCGYGYFIRFAENVGWRSNGVEIVEEIARGANDKLGESKVFRGVLKDAHFEKNHFQVVTMWDVLHSVKDPYMELSECFRIMAPGGLIGVRTRNVTFQILCFRIFQALKETRHNIPASVPYVFHEFCFSKKSLIKLFGRIGFVEIEVTNSPSTKGDPYNYTKMKAITSVLKEIVDLSVRFLHFISGRHLVLGPSILLWAKKPE